MEPVQVNLELRFMFTNMLERSRSLASLSFKAISQANETKAWKQVYLLLLLRCSM